MWGHLLFCICLTVQERVIAVVGHILRKRILHLGIGKAGCLTLQIHVADEKILKRHALFLCDFLHDGTELFKLCGNGNLLGIDVTHDLLGIFVDAG